MSPTQVPATSSTSSPADCIRLSGEPLCEECCAAPAKYRCPACERRTCSLECVKSHKEQHGCTGKRPRTEPAAPLAAFTNHIVMRDFGFLEEMDFAIDRAGREFRQQGNELHLYQRNAAQRRQALLKACASPDRRTCLTFAPAALEIARSNTSRVVGGPGGGRKNKGKNKGKGKGKGGSLDGEGESFIAWRIEWHFGKSKQVLIDRGLSERSVLDIALRRFIDNTWQLGATRHLILPYVEAGPEQLEVFLEQKPAAVIAAIDAKESAGENLTGDSSAVSASEDGPEVSSKTSYLKLDKSSTLKESFAGRAILEFPVLHVALPQECASFMRPLDK